jgi:multiple sugar transport system substrate-binding protein
MKQLGVLACVIFLLVVGLVVGCVPAPPPEVPVEEVPPEEPVEVAPPEEAFPGATEQEAETARQAADAADKGNPDPAWKGKTLTIGVYAGGAKGGISGPLYLWRNEFERLTGAKLEIIEIPFAELRAKIFTDFATATGTFDAIVGPSWFYGDYIANDWIIPIDQFLDDPRMPRWNRDGVAPAIQDLLMWGDKWYGVFNDGDTQLLYYRRDILTDPKWQAAFKEETGKDLPVPPRTWQDVLAIAKFFNGKDWNGDGDPDNGITMHLKVGGQGFFHFMSLSAPFAVVPSPGDDPTKVDRYHNVYWFDPETMEPLINKPGHVRALEFLIELSKAGSPAMWGWDLGSAWDDFLGGNAVITFSWGDVGSLAQDPARSKIQGSLGAAGIPGSTEWYDLETGRFVTNEENPNFVSNLVGASWHGVISKFSDVPDLAYYFLAWQATEPINFWNMAYGWTGVDPGAKWHFFPPMGEASVDDFVATGYDPGDAQEYINAYQQNMFGYPTTQTYLRIPGTPEYWEIWDIRLSEAITGQISPQEALDRTAKDWDAITDRLGRESQLKIYQEAIGYQK